MRIRRLEANETALFKALRRRALADAPDAFGDTHADALARPDSYWEDLTRSVTDPGRHVMFVAESDSAPVGLAFGLRDAEKSDRGRLGGMWVTPEARAHGVGRALTAAVIEWAQSQRFTRLALWVTAINRPAITLYERAGFVATGQRDVLPSNPTLETLEMIRELGPGEGES